MTKEYNEQMRRISTLSGSRTSTHHALDRIENLLTNGETINSILLRLQPPARPPRHYTGLDTHWFTEELG